MSEADTVLSPAHAQAGTRKKPFNPLHKEPRWLLFAQTRLLRYASKLAFKVSHQTRPRAPAASQVIWLDAKLSQSKGDRQIRVDIWTPPPPSDTTTTTTTTTTSQQQQQQQQQGRRPALINFHGGGMITGTTTDDAHWAGAAARELGAVVFSVGYRLAPDFPFPTPVEDCADAILQICGRADEFGIDLGRVVLSGFSAGGNMSLGSWVLLEDAARWGYRLPRPPPEFAAFVSFYPMLDLSVPPSEKRRLCRWPAKALPNRLMNMFDAAYCYPSHASDAVRRDPRMSPGLMSDELLDRLPPIYMLICEYDSLTAEAERFAERLKARGKQFVVREIAGGKHGFDKPPPLKPKESVAAEYVTALDFARKYLREPWNSSVYGLRS